jgi:predicted Rossmann fold nucleotide-binding protein DprA/Smf involved in DNA uptake
MQVSDQAQAVLLLTSHFKRSDGDEPKPLSTHEWSKFAFWLRDRGLEPASLLSEHAERLLSTWMDRTITQDRIAYLLKRGGALGLALEKWQRAGLWVMTRSDAEYPERLKKRLKLEAPPVLFGCGNKNLLNKGGIAVVGSRNASAEDLSFATHLGAKVAANGFSIVSGGARGIDEGAMLGALEREGTVVGVLADSLLRSATSAKYRNYLMSNDLALVSPFNPEAGFNAGNAMARNRYIYCLADLGVVVAAGRDRGGTWNGAIENLKTRWVPLWVKPDPNPNSGNAELVRRGAKWLPHERLDLLLLLTGQDGEPTEPASWEVLPLVRGEPQGAETSNSSTHSRGAPEAEEARGLAPRARGQTEAPSTPDPAPLDKYYDLFLHDVQSLTAEAPLGVEDLQRHLVITKSQLNSWLKRAVAEKRLKKWTNPVRYRWKNSGPAQTSMFGEG